LRGVRGEMGYLKMIGCSSGGFDEEMTYHGT